MQFSDVFYCLLVCVNNYIIFFQVDLCSWSVCFYVVYYYVLIFVFVVYFSVFNVVEDGVGINLILVVLLQFQVYVNLFIVVQ